MKFYPPVNASFTLLKNEKWRSSFTQVGWSYQFFIFMVLGSMPAFSAVFANFSGFIFFTSSTKLLLCQQHAKAFFLQFSRRWSTTFRLHLFTLSTPIGFDDDLITKLGEKKKRKSQAQTQCSHQEWRHRRRKLMREFACADILVRSFFFFKLTHGQFIFLIKMLISRKHHMQWVLLWSWREKILEELKKNTFSLARMNVLHRINKKALSPWMFCNQGECPHPADASFKQYGKHVWDGMWARSWILPEQTSFRNIEILWMFFCSSKWEMFLLL